MNSKIKKKQPDHHGLYKLADEATRELDILIVAERWFAKQRNLSKAKVASKLFISSKTVDHHLSSIFFKLDVNSRTRAVQEANRLEIIK